MEERQYDLRFICQPDTPEAEIDKIIATLEHTATEKGAKIEKVDKWGRKRMAYRVKKLREGIYVLMVLKIQQRRSDQGTRAAAESFRRGDQVHDRALGSKN